MTETRRTSANETKAHLVLDSDAALDIRCPLKPNVRFAILINLDSVITSYVIHQVTKLYGILAKWKIVQILSKISIRLSQASYKVNTYRFLNYLSCINIKQDMYVLDCLKHLIVNISRFLNNLSKNN